MEIWNILGLMAIIFLILYLTRGGNSIWSTLIIALVGGIITSIISLFLDNGFNWPLITHIVIGYILFIASCEMLFFLLFPKSGHTERKENVKVTRRRGKRR